MELLRRIELLRALSVNFVNFKVEEARSRSWASATFTGVRHALTLRLEGPGAAAAADVFLDDIEEREFDLRGHYLADIAVIGLEDIAGGGVRIGLEALTIGAD
jgi:hypothetical protein